jgi:trigger factor
LSGFEDNLEGMSAGEEKSFSLKVPFDWPDKRIVGKNLDFKVKMKLVQKRELSDINDEFAKSLGKFESLEELKNSVKDGIIQEKEIKEKQRMRIELIEKAADESEVEISAELIEQEKENMLNELKANIAGLGLGFERYLEQIKKTIEEIKKEWQEQAKKRVKIGLCLNAIAEKENIQISDEEAESRINEDLKHYENIKDIKKDVDPIKFKEYYKNILKNEKVFELLEREAKII